MVPPLPLFRHRMDQWRSMARCTQEATTGPTFHPASNELRLDSVFEISSRIQSVLTNCWYDIKSTRLATLRILLPAGKCAGNCSLCQLAVKLFVSTAAQLGGQHTS